MKGETVAELSIYSGISTFSILFFGLLLSGLALSLTSSVFAMLAVLALLTFFVLRLVLNASRRIKGWDDSKFSFALLRIFPYLAGVVLVPSLLLRDTDWGFINSMALVFQFATAWFVAHYFLLCLISGWIPPLVTWFDGAVSFVGLFLGVITFPGF